jgi:predicted dehydrogenase
MERRTFLAGGAAAAGTPGLAPANATAPNDRIGIAVIGCGGMGTMNLADFQKQPDVDIVAVCDVYAPSRERAAQTAGGKARAYADYRKVLENRDVQAVVIATPDHWHALIAIDACNAGKDVYVEKPVSRFPQEGRLMVEAARRNNRVVQVGLQQRSGTHFQRAANTLREGRLGQIHYVEAWNHDFGGTSGMGNPPDSEPPAGLDWEFWQGPAAAVPYNQNRFQRGQWRNFFDYTGGKLTDWGVHLMDIALWALDPQGPVSVTASGGKLYVKDNRQTPDTLHVLYQFPGLILSYSTLSHNSYGHNGNSGNKPFGSYGTMFHGTGGTLFVDRAGYEITPQMEGRSDPNGAGSRAAYDDLTGSGLYFTPGVSTVPAERGTTSVQHMPHVRNFLDCVKNRQRPIADIEAGHRITSLCQVGNIAFQTGERIVWDPVAERITNSEKANALLNRPYRAPWKLPGA